MGKNRVFFAKNRAMFRRFFSTERPFPVPQFDIGSLITHHSLSNRGWLYFAAFVILIVFRLSAETAFI